MMDRIYSVMDIPKSWNCISLENFEIQPRKLKIVFSRYLDPSKMINAREALYFILVE